MDPARIFDVGVAGYLLDSDEGDFSVARLFEKYVDGALPEATVDVPQAAIDAMGREVAACDRFLSPRAA